MLLFGFGSLHLSIHRFLGLMNAWFQAFIIWDLSCEIKTRSFDLHVLSLVTVRTSFLKGESKKCWWSNKRIACPRGFLLPPYINEKLNKDLKQENLHASKF